MYARQLLHFLELQFVCLILRHDRNPVVILFSGVFDVLVVLLKLLFADSGLKRICDAYPVQKPPRESVHVMLQPPLSVKVYRHFV
jgi:hypothetical protein